MVMETADDFSGASRNARQTGRRQAISSMVMAEGSVRIEELAERFDISVMTVHRDLDDLEARGLLRKSRGVATALSSALFESSDVYRSTKDMDAKRAIATAALELIEPGQAVFIDDSTTVFQLVQQLEAKTPLTVVTNALTVMNELRSTTGVNVIGLGGQYINWCSAFMGSTTTAAIGQLRADVLMMSSAAICDSGVFHQALESVDVKRAMFESSEKRYLLADHSKFEKRALHGVLQLSDFDAVIVDDGTPAERIMEMRSNGATVIVAPTRRPQA